MAAHTTHAYPSSFDKVGDWSRVLHGSIMLSHSRCACERHSSQNHGTSNRSRHTRSSQLPTRTATTRPSSLQDCFSGNPWIDLMFRMCGPRTSAACQPAVDTHFAQRVSVRLRTQSSRNLEGCHGVFVKHGLDAFVVDSQTESSCCVRQSGAKVFRDS